MDGVKGARSHGPVGQGQFLGEMGIGERLRALAEQDDVSEEQVPQALTVGCAEWEMVTVLVCYGLGWTRVLHSLEIAS